MVVSFDVWCEKITQWGVSECSELAEACSVFNGWLGLALGAKAKAAFFGFGFVGWPLMGFVFRFALKFGIDEALCVPATSFMHSSLSRSG